MIKFEILEARYPSILTEKLTDFYKKRPNLSERSELHYSMASDDGVWIYSALVLYVEDDVKEHS